MSLIRTSGCKVNLLLNILGRRPDGFHELETLMQPLPLHDELEFAIADQGVRLTTDHPTLPCDDSNLIVKAARKFFEASGLPANASIQLRKRVPMEAGLGGGSSNAATTLLALNELHGGPLDDAKLHELAAQLGSDVPFFLQKNPALAIGRGEVIESLAPFPALQGHTLLLHHPGFGISTAWAYQSLARFPAALHGRPGRARELADTLAHAGTRDWGGLLYNSLEAPAFYKYPILQMYVDCFREDGAVGAMMSGSGSTVFAFFPDRITAETCVARFQSRYGTTGWLALVAM